MAEHTIASAGSAIVVLFLTLIGYQSKRQDRLQTQIENCNTVRVEKEDMDEIRLELRENRGYIFDIMKELGVEQGRHLKD